MSGSDEERRDVPGLAAVQRWMQEVLVKPLGGEDLAPWQNLPGEFHHSPVEKLIVATGRLSARRHLHIYQSSYLLRLRECMAKQFSALEYALGDELFRHFADQYLQTYPSTSSSLSDLGRLFPQFLSETRPDAGCEEKEAWPDFLVELAAFEYAVNIAFDIPARPDDKDVEDPSNDTPDELLRLRPVLRIFENTHPVAAYYRAFFDGQQPELPLPQQAFSVLLRRRYRLGIFDVTEGQYIFLKDLQQTGSIAATQDNLAFRHRLRTATVTRTWRAWRRTWLKQGLFMVSRN